MVYSFVKKLVYKADPDILVFTGDVFVAGLTKLPVKRFVRFVERFRIPWAITFGNHDREAKYSMDKLSEIFEDTKYCLFKKGNVQNRYGNYYYNVEFEDGGKFQLIFMDSGEDNFSVESVSFYENCVQSSKVLNNGQALNNFVFFHIPTIETRLAAQEYNLNPEMGTGVLLESVCIQENDVGFFDKAVELGATKALIYGHDHINNAKIKYQGIDLCYGLKTGARPYCNKDMLGGTLYTINSDSTYQFEDIYMK